MRARVSAHSAAPMHAQQLTPQAQVSSLEQVPRRLPCHLNLAADVDPGNPGTVRVDVETGWAHPPSHPVHRTWAAVGGAAIACTACTRLAAGSVLWSYRCSCDASDLRRASPPLISGVSRVQTRAAPSARMAMPSAVVVRSQLRRSAPPKLRSASRGGVTGVTQTSSTPQPNTRGIQRRTRMNAVVTQASAGAPLTSKLSGFLQRVSSGCCTTGLSPIPPRQASAKLESASLIR
jgi:hypothetical protein